jgi:hypothetical protein
MEAAGRTTGADGVAVVNHRGRDYSRVLGAVGVWVDGQEGTSSFILENHGIGGCNNSIGLLWGLDRLS